MSDLKHKHEQHMPFITHLLELRDRILRMILGAILLLLLIFPFANDLYHFVAAPLIALLPAGTQMIATQVASPFLTPFKLTMVAAVFLSMPWILYQFWAFVAPGLYQHEKKMVLPLLVSSTLLFYLGMAFAYFVVFPLVFGFMVSTTPDGVAMMTDISAYLDFVLTLFFAFGVAFEVPVATILLVIMGVTTPESLVEKRPYIIVAAFVIGMLLTPPDVISQTLLAVPMWMLFEAGVFFARMFVSKQAEEEQSTADATTAAVLPVVATAYQPENEGDPSRFVPMTSEEMDAELDAISAREAEEESGHHECGDDTPSWDSIEDNLKHANELRLSGDEEMARDLLYDVLQHGDEKQIQVARDVLRQMDEA